MTVRFMHGVYLPEIDLWLDPQHARPLAFVSHAHADHVQRPDPVLGTAAPAAMMRARAGGAGRARFRVLEYRRPYELADCRLTLYPAGHVLGSAQALVEWQGCRLLYSGDFKL